MSSREHCWHHQGLVYDTYPSFHGETCCRCGKTRTVGSRFASEKHGPYLVGDAFEREVSDPGECVESESSTTDPGAAARARPQ